MKRPEVFNLDPKKDRAPYLLLGGTGFTLGLRGLERQMRRPLEWAPDAARNLSRWASPGPLGGP